MNELIDNRSTIQFIIQKVTFIIGLIDRNTPSGFINWLFQNNIIVIKAICSTYVVINIS